jgi:S-DNA-T family DNA segregation ATPase FtsK/SpoIIIE
MPVKPVVRKSKKIAIPPSAKNAWGDFSQPFKSGLNRMVDVSTHFGRFSQDIFSVVLVLFALLSLLALLGVTGGFLLSPWADFLKRWFGWGAPLLIIASGFLGILGLRRKKHLPGSFLGQVIIVEGLLFSVMAFLAALSNYNIDAAEQGKFGGLIGWGLADILRSAVGEFLGGAAWFAISAIFVVITSSLFQRKSAIPVVSDKKVKSGFRKVQVTEGDHAESQSLKPQESHTPVQMEIPNSQKPKTQNQMPVPQHSQPGSGHKKPETTALVNLGSMPISSSGRKPVVDKSSVAVPVKRDGDFPPLGMLMEEQVIRMDESTINQSASILEKTLMDFGVPARVVGYRIGPTVTQFAVEPGYIEKPAPDGQILKQKVRVNQISTLSRDLALALSSTSIRIEAPVPGRSYVGIEIPNIRTVTVRLKPLLESERFAKINAPLALALGRDVSGQPVVADLGRMPHMLVAGTTGSGKSVCIAAIAACLAMNNSPEDLRIVMVDPKMVELVRFNGLPHLMGKVEVELERIQGVLKWVINEMDTRYKLFAEIHARDLNAYNKKMERQDIPTLPRIVLIIDELADLMMNAPTQTEPALVRLAQLARATGIHLIVATQRPSTDVVTGLIKANFPARIAFAVASNTDSRVILDTPGAENLLGRGDMLFLNPEVGTPIRAQGVMVSDEEIDKIIQHWQNELPDKLENSAPWEMMLEEEASGGDELIQQAIEIIKQTRKASASLLQRRLRIGYPRAASLIDELEDMGIIGPATGAGREREVLIDSDPDEYEEP